MRDVGDPCCFACRTPSGVCASKHQCEHHRLARAEFENRRPPHPDPTGEHAVGNVMRAQRERNRGRRKT